MSTKAKIRINLSVDVAETLSSMVSMYKDSDDKEIRRVAEMMDRVIVKAIDSATKEAR